MEYRNAGNATHLSNGGAFGVGSSAGVELGGGSTAGSITACGDGTNENLVITAKGAGNLKVGDSSNVLYVSGSTTPFKLVTGMSTTAVPNMPANSQVVSTMTCVGISTGDIVLSVSPRDGLSTGVTLSRSYAGTNEIINVWINPHASSIAAEAEQNLRWAYIDRT